MRMEYLLRPEAVECAPTDTLLAVAQRMRAHQVSALAVVDEVGLVGMISTDDLVRAMAEDADPAAARVRDHSAPVRDIAVPSEDTRQVMRRMLDNGLEHIPVLHGTSVVNVVPLRHLVAVEPSIGDYAAKSTSDPAGTPARDHRTGLHQSRHTARRRIPCPVRRHTPAARREVSHEPTHLGDAGWWLERTDLGGAAPARRTPRRPVNPDEEAAVDPNQRVPGRSRSDHCMSRAPSTATCTASH